MMSEHTADPDQDSSPDGVIDPSTGQEEDQSEQGGEAACFAFLVCPECGAVTTEGHQPGCTLATAAGR
jgi:hypothetical protein